MMHTMCGVRCNITRLHIIPPDVSGTGPSPFIRDAIPAKWLIKCPACGKEVRRKTKEAVILAAKAEGFSD